MKKCRNKIKKIYLKETSTSFSRPWQVSQFSNLLVLPVKSSIFTGSFVWIEMHLWTIISSGPQGWQVPNPQWHTWCFTTKLHRTASTVWWCEYLNGYMTVQHHSFRKPSFLASWILDPRSSKLETRSSRLETQSLHLETRNSKRLSFKTRGSGLKFRASSVNLLLSSTVEKISHSLMCECFPNGCSSL